MLTASVLIIVRQSKNVPMKFRSMLDAFIKLFYLIRVINVEKYNLFGIFSLPHKPFRNLRHMPALETCNRQLVFAGKPCIGAIACNR